MLASAEVEIRPEFQIGSEGKLFVQQFIPSAEKPVATCIIVPPFAEEMNRSRRTMAMLGASLARSQVKAILPDLYGTGDSEGEFGDCGWATWQLDIVELGRRCDPKIPITVIGVRSGCLLAAKLAEECNANQLVLLQPVIDGGSFLRQFFRLASASALVGNRTGYSAKEIASMLQDGEAVEIAGYKISPSLHAELGDMRLHDSKPGCPVTWLEIGSAEEVPVMAKRVANAWSDQASMAVDIGIINDPPFWRTQEISVGKNTVARVCAVMRH